MISWFVPQASTFAADVDSLIFLILVIVGAWFLLAEAVLFWLILRFRKREGVRSKYVTGDVKSEKRWVSYPHYAVLVFDVVIVVAALRVWNDVKVTDPVPEETVRVVSQQWAWTFVHAGPDGRLDTADDIKTVDDLYVQQNRTYRFELHSKDVLHSFSVPAFRLKQDAVPGRMIAGWFKPTLAGDFDIQCAEICGIGHGLMPARIHVQTATAHQEWLREHGVMPALAANTGAAGQGGAR
ncbi:MAG: cytochrome c oxidase subunit II [Acidobacteria bacterium]|nr:cytochrome c oxidase subunit II [Acidobacteriota bacterium]